MPHFTNLILALTLLSTLLLAEHKTESSSSKSPLADAERGSRFEEVWDKVASDPYVGALPTYEVTFGSMGEIGDLNKNIRDSANRTLNDRRDLLPRWQKLVHANGICFAGTWNVTEENPYGGYFQKGKIGLMIARASIAMSKTEKGEFRAFGFAGKVYPTDDPKDPRHLKPAHFFLVENLGGTLTPHFTDAFLVNEPPVTKRLSPRIAIGIAVKKAFEGADSNPLIRQVYEIADLGAVGPKQKHLAPTWMAIQAVSSPKADKSDFREELRLKNYEGNKLVFNILVSSDAKAGYKKIGFIELKEDATSDSCDHRLHFPHPKFRSEN